MEAQSMRRNKEYSLEVTVEVDNDEVDTAEKELRKEKQIREAIEGLDPSIGIFIVENL
jgi:hypothetical protein